MGTLPPSEIATTPATPSLKANKIFGIRACKPGLAALIGMLTPDEAVSDAMGLEHTALPAASVALCPEDK